MIRAGTCHVVCEVLGKGDVVADLAVVAEKSPVNLVFLTFCTSANSRFSFTSLTSLLSLTSLTPLDAFRPVGQKATFANISATYCLLHDPKRSDDGRDFQT